MDMIDLLVAKGWGEKSVLVNTVATLAASARSQITVRPVISQHAIAYHIQPLIPLPEDMGQTVVRAGGGTAITATTYADIITWTVATARSGGLAELMMDTTNWVRTNWRVTIAGVQQFTDQVFNSSPSFHPPFPNQLPQGAVVAIAAASTDGTSVTPYAGIAGKEFPTHVFTLDVEKGEQFITSTIPVAAGIVKNGIGIWVHIQQKDPLVLTPQNVNGFGDERFVVATSILYTDSERLKRINRFMRRYGSRNTEPNLIGALS